MGVVVALELLLLLVRPALVPETSPEAAPLRQAIAALPTGTQIAQILGRGALCLGIALALFSIQLVVWKIVYGAYFVQPQGWFYARPWHPWILELLFAAKNGW